MPYVQRDENNQLNGVYVNLQEKYAEEWLEENSAEVIAFFQRFIPPKNDGISD